MVRDLEAARRYALVGNREADLLSSPARPIVLVDRRADGSTIAPSVAPAVPDLGLLLAYTPLHTLLLGWPGEPPFLDALVATSGNLSGETIVADDDEAFSRLAPLVDAWLVHDRAVHVACDDSVLRVVDGEPLPLRRARGYAPLPVSLALDVSPTLATASTSGTWTTWPLWERSRAPRT
jgi:hydrogenase maturation protein HypF